MARRLVSFLSGDLFPSNFLFESRRYWFTYPFVCSRNATDRDRGACMDVKSPSLRQISHLSADYLLRSSLASNL